MTGKHGRGRTAARAGAQGSPRRWLWRLCAALLLWGAGFVALYGGLSLGCAAGWQLRPLLGSNWLTLALAALWLLQLAALAGLWAALHRQAMPAGADPHPLRKIALVCAATAFAATLWIGWPVLVLPACAGWQAGAAAAAAPAADGACGAAGERHAG